MRSVGALMQRGEVERFCDVSPEIGAGTSCRAEVQPCDIVLMVYINFDNWHSQCEIICLCKWQPNCTKILWSFLFVFKIIKMEWYDRISFPGSVSLSTSRQHVMCFRLWWRFDLYILWPLSYFNRSQCRRIVVRPAQEETNFSHIRQK